MTEFRIDTARLVIRAWRPEDRPAMERWVADSEMMRYMSNGEPWPRERVDETLARQARNLEIHGACMGAVELRETGDAIGICGLQPHDIPGQFELGWWIWKDYWGRGLATEAARGAANWGFQIMALPYLVAIAHPDNVASIRVMEKIGMHFVRRGLGSEMVARLPDIDVVLYELPAPDSRPHGAEGSGS
ncbi:MAG: GNAT family N-acetyltransferase [Gammaproteobacteria bacterium]